MPKALWGGKVTNSHSTISDTAGTVLNAANKLNEVTKISIGIIRHIGGGEKRLKFLPIIGGVKAVVRGNGVVQELFIYTKDPSATQEKIKQAFLQ